VNSRTSHPIFIGNAQPNAAAIRGYFFGFAKSIAFTPLLPLFVTVAGKLALEKWKSPL
jgi:hypothetical protein